MSRNGKTKNLTVCISLSAQEKARIQKAAGLYMTAGEWLRNRIVQRIEADVTPPDPAGDHGPRTSQLNVRISENHRRLFERHARKASREVSSWMRDIALEAFHVPGAKA